MNARTRKSPDKQDRPTPNAKHKQQSAAMDLLLRGLDTLAAHAESEDMGTAARIFYTAKEDLVHWAVTMNFYETAQDRFINQRLYDSRLSTVESLIIRALKNSATRDEMFHLLGLPASPPPAISARK